MKNWTKNSELALASYVALRLDDWKPEHGCPAWIESKERQCGKDPHDPEGVLCKRHRTVASNRHQKSVEKYQAQKAKRDAHRAEMLPKWKEELARMEADMERYGGLPTTDRAAYGGASHPSIRKAQMRQLSDTNVQRMARLSRRSRELRAKIGKE